MFNTAPRNCLSRNKICFLIGALFAALTAASYAQDACSTSNFGKPSASCVHEGAACSYGSASSAGKCTFVKADGACECSTSPPAQALMIPNVLQVHLPLPVKPAFNCEKIVTYHPQQKVCNQTAFNGLQCVWQDVPPTVQTLCLWQPSFPEMCVGNDYIRVSTQCCTSGKAVGVTLAVADNLTWWKGITIDNDTLGVTGRGETAPNTPPKSQGPILRQLHDVDGHWIVFSKAEGISAAHTPVFKINLAELTALGGQNVTFLWADDAGFCGVPDPIHPYTTDSGAPLDGTELKDGNGTLWVTQSNAKFKVPADAATFAQFYAPAQIYDSGSLDQAPYVPADGSILRETGGATHIAFGQSLFLIPDPATLTRLYSGTPVVNIWDNPFSWPNPHVPSTPPPIDGTLLREESGSIFVVLGRGTRHVPDLATLDAYYHDRPIFQLWNGAVTGGIPGEPADGTLLRQENGDVWLIDGRAKFHVPNPDTLNRLFGVQPVYTLWDGALDDIGLIPVDGALLQEENGARWAIGGGAKFQLANGSYIGTTLITLWTGATHQIPDTPYDGTLLHVESNDTYLYIAGRAQWQSPDFTTAQRLWAPVTTYQIHPGTPLHIATSPIDKTVLREENGTTWVMVGGAKFHVPNPNTLTQLYAGIRVFQMWNGALDGFGLIPRDGTVLKEITSAMVYQIVQGRKVAVPAPLDQLGINVLWDGALAQIP